MKTHIDLCEKLPDPMVIKTDPDNAPIVEDIGLGYYVAHMVAYWADKPSMDAICTYARRCPHEIATTMIGEVVKHHPECKETQAYIAFRCEYDPTQV